MLSNWVTTTASCGHFKGLRLKSYGHEYFPQTSLTRNESHAVYMSIILVSVFSCRPVYHTKVHHQTIVAWIFTDTGHNFLSSRLLVLFDLWTRLCCLKNVQFQEDMEIMEWDLHSDRKWMTLETPLLLLLLLPFLFLSFSAHFLDYLLLGSWWEQWQMLSSTHCPVQSVTPP